MGDVIKGPGEYRTREGEIATVIAIVMRKAIGYIVIDGDPRARDWIARTGEYIEGGEECSSDILPPAPVIDAPGPYECRDGGTFHCAYVDPGGIAWGYHGQYPTTVSALTGLYDEKPEERDVIRKRVTP